VTTTTRAATQPPVTTTAAVTQPSATTVATTQPPATISFPLHNYGTFFRNEYGSNANIISALDGGILLDIGSTSEGVLLVRVISIPSSKICKAIMKGPSGSTYQYEIKSRDAYEGLPLQMGNGSYTVTLYEQVSGTSYVSKMAQTFNVTLSSSLRPFTASSVIVNFSSGSPSTAKASSLCSGKPNQVARIEAVYLWVVGNITYDRVLAASITSGEVKTYIPNPDTTMSTRKGICYDYAALLAAMLRSQGIPTRLIMGQVPQGYHAWNEVYIEGTGWVVIASFNYKEVDGSAWIMFDSTFASGGVSSQTILSTTHTKERTY
jgi:transglutaminase-like putative cysteine protease